MSEFFDENEVFENEGVDMGSINHSITQAKLACLLGIDERFTVMTELSLDISQHDISQYGVKAKDEVKPDVCVYSNEIGYQESDIIRMVDMPLLAIEILSPSQGTKELKDKIHAYFDLGVKSCWLVIPDIQLISVHTKQGSFTNFDRSDNEVVDKVMDIHLSIPKIFGKTHKKVQVVNKK
jgi:Uma2 family endonuclease